VDVLVSTSANATEDLLEHRGARFYQVEPERVDDVELRRQGYYRFYDHVVSAADYDAMEDFTGEFFKHLGATWPAPTISGLAFMRELGRWLDAQGLGPSLAATCFRHGVPLFVPAAPDGPLSEGYRSRRRRAARRGLLRRLPPAHRDDARLHAARAGHRRHLPGRRRAQGLHPDRGDERLDPARHGRAEPARGGHPDHDRQRGLRRASAAPAWPASASRGARSRRTATT
jgi:hypothetical protein